jgi:hypothetical protein
MVEIIPVLRSIFVVLGLYHEKSGVWFLNIPCIDLHSVKSNSNISTVFTIIFKSTVISEYFILNPSHAARIFK